jgi:NMD protein affecting ribosome stability and mRNA decay
MTTTVITVRVNLIEKGDVVMVDGDPKVVEDVRENRQMTVVLLSFTGGHDRFYDYDETIGVVVDTIQSS